jgi:hypothetical protein
MVRSCWQGGRRPRRQLPVCITCLAYTWSTASNRAELRRELAEELGVDSEVGTPFAAFSYMADGGVHTVAILYYARLLGEPELRTAENAEFVWVTPEDCAAYFDPADPVFAAITSAPAVAVRWDPGCANSDSC